MTRFVWARCILCLCAVLFFLTVPAADGGEGMAVDEMRTGVLILPASVQTVGESAFEETAANEIVLPPEVRVIEDRAFANMPGLQAVNLPESIQYMGEDVFAGDPGVTLYGVSGGWAEEYARRNNLPFRRTDAALPSGREDMWRVRRAIVLYLLAQALIFIFRARFTGRRPGETRLICRRERIALHALDLCFP